MRPTEYTTFLDRLQTILDSEGQEVLPNVVEVEDPQEALNLINRASYNLAEMKEIKPPYRLRLFNFDPPKNGRQTCEITYHPRIFLNSAGMGGRFEGSGVILFSGSMGKARVLTFKFCEHDWDESGANHSRGWHPAVCKKCGFDASIDSGD